MMLRFSTYGDWDRAGIVLRGISKNLQPAFRNTLDVWGKRIEQRIQQHIDKEDLWKSTPLSPTTVKLKDSNKIYVESGRLRNSIRVQRLGASSKGYNVFIGVPRSGATSKRGMQLNKLLALHEYGGEGYMFGKTSVRIPARPLIRPTWNEVKHSVRADMKATLQGLIRTGAAGNYAADVDTTNVTSQARGQAKYMARMNYKRGNK